MDETRSNRYAWHTMPTPKLPSIISRVRSLPVDMPALAQVAEANGFFAIRRLVDFRSQTRPDLEGALVSEIVQGLQLTTDIDAVIPLSEFVSVVFGVTAWQSFDGKNFDYSIDALSASTDAGLLLTFQRERIQRAWNQISPTLSV
ncbi:MAG: hypothetical protein AAF605_03730 [Myxococcota bacterium]